MQEGNEQKKQKLDVDPYDIMLAKKRVISGIQGVIVGCSGRTNGRDDDPQEAYEQLYEDGIGAIKQRQEDLEYITLSSKDIMPVFVRMFLKDLVIKQESELLASFLDVYERSYPHEGINFTYTSKTVDRSGKAAEIKYTLLEVATAALLDAADAQKPHVVQSQIVQLIIDHGGEVYSNNAHPRMAINRDLGASDQKTDKKMKQNQLDTDIAPLEEVFLPGLLKDGVLGFEEGASNSSGGFVHVLNPQDESKQTAFQSQLLPNFNLGEDKQ
jgi:hypothetical protein